MVPEKSSSDDIRRSMKRFSRRDDPHESQTSTIARNKFFKYQQGLTRLTSQNQLTLLETRRAAFDRMKRVTRAVLQMVTNSIRSGFTGDA
jgi:hypothetical protein